MWYMTALDTPARLREAREAANLTQMEAWVRLRDRLPACELPSQPTISRMENGKAPCSPIVVIALAAIYGVKPDELDHTVDEYVSSIQELLGSAQQRGDDRRRRGDRRQSDDATVPFRRRASDLTPNMFGQGSLKRAEVRNLSGTPPPRPARRPAGRPKSRRGVPAASRVGSWSLSIGA